MNGKLYNLEAYRKAIAEQASKRLFSVRNAY